MRKKTRGRFSYDKFQAQEEGATVMEGGVPYQSTALHLTSTGIIQKQQLQSGSLNVRKLHFHTGQYNKQASAINTSHFNLQHPAGTTNNTLLG
jgi:hypothetical protein